MLMEDPRLSVTHILQGFLDGAIESQFVILENGGAAVEFLARAEVPRRARAAQQLREDRLDER